MPDAPQNATPRSPATGGSAEEIREKVKQVNQQSEAAARDPWRR
jgi:hypothetical protein